MNKILLSVTAFVLLTASPAFATSDSSIDTATVPAEAAPTLDAPTEPATEMPADPTAVPTFDTTAPTITEPAPATMDTAPTDTTVPADTTTAPATIDTTTPTPDTTVAEPAVTEPVVEEKKEEPAKPKVSPPAKLSALAKKYDLMSLDTDGNKSLSKDEFTANGFANAKTFAGFDLDGNGKLTNYEINAYAARIEANSNK